MIIANVHKAKTELSKLIAATLAGEEVFIAKAGEPVVKMVKTRPKKSSKRVPGLFKGKIWVSSDFDDEDPEINKLFYGE